MFPITEPRRIVSGLGNIVRQIEIDGKPTPASSELETAVQQVINRRAKSNPDVATKTIAVWALVIPPSIADSLNVSNFKLPVNKHSDLDDEVSSAMNGITLTLDDKPAIQHSVSRLVSEGCRVYRVRKWLRLFFGCDNAPANLNSVSGGGGWGKKQGLLSLDPETSYTSETSQGMEDFIESFQNQYSGASQHGVVSPGSYLQFFIAPSTAVQAGELAPRELFEGLAIGTADSQDEFDVPNQDGMTNGSWTLVPGHFGGVSSHGIFISGHGPRGPLQSKIDTPGSYLYGKIYGR
jgi:hypothetical protein